MVDYEALVPELEFWMGNGTASGSGGECKGMFGRRKMVKVKSTAGCRMTYNLGKVHGSEGRDLSSPEVVPPSIT